MMLEHVQELETEATQLERQADAQERATAHETTQIQMQVQQSRPVQDDETDSN